MIKGDTVGLRAIEKNDLPLLQEWRNYGHFRRNFREHRELSLFHQERWYERLQTSVCDYMFMIVRLDDDEPLGATGLLYVNWILRSADCSLYIGHGEEYIDSVGYAHEATSLLLHYGFGNLNLNKVWMELYEFDTAKLNFFTKEFSFKIDGTLRDNCFEDGRYWSSYMLSLLRADYDNIGGG